MPYIHFTEEQKLRASRVDLPEFLRRQGENLIRSGSEFRMASDHSVTIRGNEWYDHESNQGGGPISFVQTRYGMSYPDAVTRLLEGERGLVRSLAPEANAERKRDFLPPLANREMRRVFSYLLQKRLISREVLTAFVREGLVYEDANYHNAVFIGKDEHGVVRHAHQRSTGDRGRPFRANTLGSDPRYSFHWGGTSNRLYVFEAPIDLLSFLTLYPKDWQAHSYVALCGVGERALLWMLEQHPEIRHAILCLDHDLAGIEAAGRLAELISCQGQVHPSVLRPRYKDWNEDLKAQHGLEAQPAREHPQLAAAPEICRSICALSKSTLPDRLDLELPRLLEQCRGHLRSGRTEQATDCSERMAALALAACRLELRQLGKRFDDGAFEQALCLRLPPHRNRGSLSNTLKDVAAQLQSTLSRSTAPGIRSEEGKRALADRWLELAAAFARLPVRQAAEELEHQEQKPARQIEIG